MNNPDTTRSLDLLDNATDTGGCGCGGADKSTAGSSIQESQMTAGQTTQSFAVTGMTCGHCSSAVTSELMALDGVTDVEVRVVVGGTSTVTITSAAPLDQLQVAAALDEAGGYQLA